MHWHYIFFIFWSIGCLDNIRRKVYGVAHGGGAAVVRSIIQYWMCTHAYYHHLCVRMVR